MQLSELDRQIKIIQDMVAQPEPGAVQQLNGFLAGEDPRLLGRGRAGVRGREDLVRDAGPGGGYLARGDR